MADPLPEVDLSEPFYDPKIPFEEQAKKRTEEFTQNMASTYEAMKDLEYPDVPDTDCIASFEFYKQENLFDLTCKEVNDLALGDGTAFWLQKAVDYYNEASRGKCVSISEP